ncbi:hypothetical protein PTSG_10867 [Salpingoeca rosetta]|uniref:Uncharacterized protein n=1 Tax=Salpingoeca rosetta (strain ATCC 50818 / BSB-021) TaxID=946362 RepID=F2UR84_SALR5|nr:uncharacterized protein PTSG_10867 [Salpingoeca rosetta]EGD80187.1 hypothetical protein PTSG_10867 [Salpingoeca rosetta]|eukprot:XP_004988249.1 hypothetical protein PTSG_10867 [Salpingoeca rosetta]
MKSVVPGLPSVHPALFQQLQQDSSTTAVLINQDALFSQLTPATDWRQKSARRLSVHCSYSSKHTAFDTTTAMLRRCDQQQHDIDSDAGRATHMDEARQATAPKVKCTLEATTSVGSIPGSSSTISATTATTPTNANSTVYRDRPVDINHARWLAKDASTTAATTATE